MIYQSKGWFAWQCFQEANVEKKKATTYHIITLIIIPFTGSLWTWKTVNCLWSISFWHRIWLHCYAHGSWTASKYVCNLPYHFPHMIVFFYFAIQHGGYWPPCSFFFTTDKFQCFAACYFFNGTSHLLGAVLLGYSGSTYARKRQAYK